MSELTKDLVTELFPNAITRKYAKGQLILYQGDKPTNIFFISSGHVRYYDVDDEGNEKVLHFMGDDNIFPMLYAFGVTPEVPAFYAATDVCEIIAIPLRDFINVTQTNADFANSLIRWFLYEINQLVYRISSLEKTDARLKVLYALKYLSDSHGVNQEDWQKLTFPITHQFIADFTGLARETVSLTLTQLKKENIIKAAKQHQLQIKSSTLEQLA